MVHICRQGFFWPAFMLVLTTVAHAQAPPWKFSAADGSHSITFGFLAQPQFESLTNPSGTAASKNLFMRRLRFIAGGKVTPKLSFFVESCAGNLGKKAADGTRTADFYLQDAYATYAFRPEFQVDGGMIIVPVSHNSAQSATSLLPVDYGPYSFAASDPTHSKVGRDYGLQFRGYVHRHFEYRVGAFRGHRDPDSTFPFRYMARFVWYPFNADTGFFYTGTTVAQRRIVGIGASFDRQGHYSANAVDLFVDQPLANGDAVTFQTDFIRYDGGTTFPSLPRQNAWLIESSYYFHAAKLGPFVQAASRDYTKPLLADEKKIQGGVALWLMAHRVNVKLGLARLLKDRAPDRTQFVVQTQLFYF
jgi:hypothetical protein